MVDSILYTHLHMHAHSDNNNNNNNNNYIYIYILRNIVFEIHEVTMKLGKQLFKK